MDRMDNFIKRVIYPAARAGYIYKWVFSLGN
jgi:hypothetical protein